jgi:predicted esterase
MRLIALAALLAAAILLIGDAGAAPRTGTYQMSLPGYTTQIWVSVPGSYKKSQSKKWGLIVGLHGAGQPAGSYLGGWTRLLGSGGYIMVSPQSCTGGGVWNIDGKGDNAKECEYILKIVEKLLKEYDLNPEMIHVNGFSAGSAMCAVGVAGDSSFRKFKQKSFVGFSGGFQGKMSANADKAKETKVRIYNGSADAGHVDPSKFMYQAFKDAGYDAEHIVVPGKGHTYPLVNHKEIINWYATLDKASRKKGEYVKLASQAEETFKKKDYAKAKKLYEKLQKDAGTDLKDLAEKAKKGLEEIEKTQQEAIKKIEELKAAGDKEKLAEYCKEVSKQFSKMDAADKAKEALKGISRTAKTSKKEPEDKTPRPKTPKTGPAEETAATLLSKARSYIASEAYEAAARALNKIMTDFPGTPEADEASKLLEEVESEM